jgi:predicted ester cyclase
MSAADVREVLTEYVEVLLARGNYGRFFSDDVHLEVVGSDQSANGAEAAEQMIRFFHEIAFDTRPQIVNVLVDEQGGAVEAVFMGTHTGEFAGIGATGNTVRVPYSAFYDVADGRITGLRLYFSLDQLIAQIMAPVRSATAG